jgi:hypothetical protein
VAALTPDKIDDLVLLTLENAVKGEWQDISLAYQHYFFVSAFMQRMEVPEDGGPFLTWTLQVDNTDTATSTGLFDRDNLNIKDLAQKPRVDWAMQTANWSYDVRESEFNNEPHRIVDYIAMRRHSMYNDFFTYMEERMWQAGASTDDPRNIYGIPYWIVKNSTAAFGFNGADHTDWTGGPGGILSASYPKWKNGTGTYQVLSDDDGLEKLSTAMDFCHFQAPDSYPEIDSGMPDWWLCTTHPVKLTMERLLRSGNDNIGRDLGKWRGTPAFRSVPVRWVPALTESTSPAADSAWPIYGLNLKSFDFVYREGYNQRIDGPVRVPESHNRRAVHLDNSGNFRCFNRRSNFVLYKV